MLLTKNDSLYTDDCLLSTKKDSHEYVEYSLRVALCLYRVPVSFQPIVFLILLLCVSVFVSVLSPVCCVCLCLTFYGNLKVLVPRFLPGAAGVEFLSISVLRGCVSINYMLTITIKVGFFDIFLILYLHFLRVYKFRR